jgi:hypothetical protein
MNWKDDKILLWIDIFTKPNSSFRSVGNEEDGRQWQPNDGEEKVAFEALIAKENRELLKAWYARSTQVEGHPDLFRKMLENAISEELPVGEKI